MQDIDNEIYVKLAKEPGSTSIPITGKGLLETAVKTLKQHVQNHINTPNPEESLKDLSEYVQTKVQFLPLLVPSEGDGYLVFDTTNTRGLQLSPAEGLKARLATIAREDRELSDRLMHDWNRVARLLEEKIVFEDPKAIAVDAMDDYLHAVWCSRNGYTTKHTMDRRIGSALTGVRPVSEFVEDLTKYCDSYLAVRAPSGKSWTNEDLKDLRHLNRQSFSFLTMVYEHALERFSEAVSLTLSLQIRNISIGPQQAHAFEKNWPEWARLVREGLIDEAFGQIRASMASDEEFESRFAKAIVRGPATASHLLRRLDQISRPNSGVQPMDVDLEHILPKSVVTKLSNGKRLNSKTERWIKDLGHEIPETFEDKRRLGDELMQPLYMLGNQALLNYRLNRSVKDQPFERKRELYREQALELTKALAECETWGLDQIQARQYEMANRAIQTWSS